MCPADETPDADIRIVDFGLMAVVSGSKLTELAHDLTGAAKP